MIFLLEIWILDMKFKFCGNAHLKKFFYEGAEEIGLKGTGKTSEIHEKKFLNFTFSLLIIWTFAFCQISSSNHFFAVATTVSLILELKKPLISFVDLLIKQEENSGGLISD